MNMSPDRARWPLLVVGGIGLLAIGVVIGRGMNPLDLLRRDTPAPSSTQFGPGGHAGHGGMAIPAETDRGPASDAEGGAAPSGTGASAFGGREIVVTLTPEMVARAAIKTAPATLDTMAVALRMPAVVQPDAYKEVTVTSLVSGRVTQVRAELGQRVMLGDALATVYSPELTDAQTNFIAIKAEHTAHNQRQARAQRLFAIGAVSRQELDALEAERVRMDAVQEAARARLALLGIPEERAQRLATPLDVVTTIDVRAPLTGVVTKRTANPGLNIDDTTPLFTVVDVSDVWVVADLYERDFGKVRVGSPVIVTSASYSGLALRGRVDYIDPQVQESTRTAKLRVQVPNAGGRLRFGMYVDVEVEGASSSRAVVVPKSAVQSVGAQSVVYLASEHEPGRFTERRIQIGETSGDRVRVASGLEPGALVVTEGAFFLRAERERSSQR
jgi:RND family efflux transporter MFP subunit